MSTEAQTTETEVLDSATLALSSIERASIDQQVATAHQFPRSIKQFMADAKDMVTLDLETAEGCYYRLERKDKKSGEVKVIEGPSVRLLEIAASCYGNIRYGSRVIAIEDKFVVTQGVAHDLQRNVFSSSETRRRITTKDGYRFGDDMIGVTANAACSIAKRNALNGIVPRVYVNQLCDLAMATARGTHKTLTERRSRALAYFSDKLGVKADKVLAKLGRKGVEDITLEDLDRLNGLKTAIKDGDTTVDLEFNPQPEQAPNKGLGDLIGKTPDATAPKTPPAEPPPAEKPAAKVYTPEERAKVIAAVEGALLQFEVGETKVLKWALEHGFRTKEQDEIGTLTTETLLEVLEAIPTIKGGVK